MTDLPDRFSCYLVEPDGNGATRGNIVEISQNELPAGDVTIRVRYSSLNYKDALAASGHPGVALQLPLVPGIDAVGTVVESQSGELAVGQSVLVSAADFGTRHWGGWSLLARVPGSWCYAIPPGLTELETIALGTAGFTAAQSVEQLQRHDVTPDSGPVIVSGATGGVGIFAVMLLARLGYHVVASTGKTDRHDWLREFGASEIVARQQLDDQSGRPMLSSRWAGGIDSVGGNALATILRSTRPGGCVTACGLVAGHELNMTVYPFILRGICLQGIDSANVSRAECQRIWRKLGSQYKLDNLDKVISRKSLGDVQACVTGMLRGETWGRTVVNPIHD